MKDIAAGQAIPSETAFDPLSTPQKHRFVTGGKFVGMFMPSESTATGCIVGTPGNTIMGGGEPPPRSPFVSFVAA